MDFPGKDRLPTLGVGLSFRPEIADALYEHLDSFEFMEVIVDNALSMRLDRRFWDLVPSRLPLLGHGVNCSIGSLEPLDRHYLKRAADVARRMHCRWFSEHLAFTHSDDVEIGQLIPVQFTAENADFIAEKIRDASDIFGCPFLIENVAYYFRIPGSTMSEVEFITRVLEKARCGLLLDVHNLYANSINHDFDPYVFIDQLPAAAVVEVHVAGGAWRDGLYVDTHGHAVATEVLALVEHVLATKQPNAVVLEREKNFPAMATLLDELGELQRLWSRRSTRIRCSHAQVLRAAAPARGSSDYVSPCNRPAQP